METDIEASATMDIQMDVDGVMKEKADIINHFCHGSEANMLLMRELISNGYMRGFMGGVKHGMKTMPKENGK